MPSYSRQKAWEDRPHWEEIDQPPKWIERRMESFQFEDSHGEPTRYYILTGKRLHYRIRELPRNGHMEIVVERSPRGEKGRLYERKVEERVGRKGLLSRLFGRG
jgi:hypothetical protein